jgi:hypothetical protein
MEKRMGRIDGLQVRKVGTGATLSGGRLGRIVGVVMAVALTMAWCSFGGERGRYVQARWVSGETEITLPEVKPGVGENISFEMNIDQSVPSLRLEIAHSTFREMGISIPDVAMTAASGKVSSTVHFDIKANTPARRYVLTILARDAATSRIVARAEIPFAVYPYSIEKLFGCSC